MWWKTSKDRLIDLLHEQLAEKRLEIERLHADRELLLASLAPQPVVKPESPPPRSGPRTEAERCRMLTEISRQRAVAKGRNLVAEMPPPGANPHGAA